MNTITEDVILDYNSKKPHKHFNYLTPNDWAYKARKCPDQNYTFSKCMSESEFYKDIVVERSDSIIEVVKEISLEKGK